jgi:hypothetical protein
MRLRVEWRLHVGGFGLRVHRLYMQLQLGQRLLLPSGWLLPCGLERVPPEHRIQRHRRLPERDLGPPSESRRAVPVGLLRRFLLLRGDDGGGFGSMRCVRGVQRRNMRMARSALLRRNGMRDWLRVQRAGLLRVVGPNARLAPTLR